MPDDRRAHDTLIAIRVLSALHWSPARVASVLGLTRTTVRRHLEGLRLARAAYHTGTTGRMPTPHT